MLSRPPPPLALATQPRISRHQLESRDKWKAWLTKTLKEAKDKLNKAQERYKRNYDKRLRKQREEVKKDNHVYLRVERRDETQTRHKLAAVAEGPFTVISAKGNTVLIERNDKTVERVSRDRVTLAPPKRTAEEIQEVVRPLTDLELEPDEYPVSEQVNNRDKPADAGEIRSKTRQRPVVNEVNNDLQPSRDGIEEARDQEASQDEELEAQDEEGDRQQSEDPGEQEYVMERIISHGINRDTNHPSAKVGEMTYRVRWYGYPPDQDTYEPIRHLPRNHVVRYHKRRRLQSPANLDEAMNG